MRAAAPETFPSSCFSEYIEYLVLVDGLFLLFMVGGGVLFTQSVAGPFQHMMILEALLHPLKMSACGLAWSPSGMTPS